MISTKPLLEVAPKTKRERLHCWLILYCSVRSAAIYVKHKAPVYLLESHIHYSCMFTVLHGCYGGSQLVSLSAARCQPLSLWRCSVRFIFHQPDVRRTVSTRVSATNTYGHVTFNWAAVCHQSYQLIACSRWRLQLVFNCLRIVTD